MSSNSGPGAHWTSEKHLEDGSKSWSIYMIWFTCVYCFILLYDNYVYIYIYMYIYIIVYIYVYNCIYMYMSMHRKVHICVYMFIYIVCLYMFPEGWGGWISIKICHVDVKTIGFYGSWYAAAFSDADLFGQFVATWGKIKTYYYNIWRTHPAIPAISKYW
jgi:hypothetical protein